MRIPAKRVNGKLDYTEALKVNIPRFFKEFNTLKDLLPRLAVKLVGIADDQTIAAVVNKALKKKLKEDPDFEVWLKAKYFPYTKAGTSKKEYRDFDYLMVSNKGRFFDLRTYRPLSGYVAQRGYKTLVADGYPMSAHRLVCYRFNPIPQHLLNYPLGELEVNHKNAVKGDNDFENLEWATPDENMKHARENGLIIALTGMDHRTVRPMVATVVDIPEFNGTEFVVVGQRECEELGINHKVLYDIRTGKAKTYRGCTWREIPKESVEKFNRNPSAALVKAIQDYEWSQKDRPCEARQKWVYFAKHIKTGVVTEYRGWVELRQAGFIYPNVLKCIKGERATHKKHTFTKELIQ